MKHKVLKIVAAVVALILVALLILSQMLSAFVNVDEALAPLRQHVKELTGQPLITEAFDVSVIPRPKITIRGVAIRNITEALQPYLLYADELSVTLSMRELFLEKNPQIKAISIKGLKLYFERDPQGHRNWEFIDKAQQQASRFDGLMIGLENASFTFVDRRSDFKTELSQAGGSLMLGQSEVQLNLSGNMGKQQVRLSGACQMKHFGHLSSFDADCTGAAQGEGLKLDAKNRLIMAQGVMQTRGSFTLDTQDFRIWGDALLSQEKEMLQHYASSPLPLKAQIETHSDGVRLVANATSLQMGQSTGKASIQVQQQGANEQLKLQAAFEKLAFDELKGLIAESAGGEEDIFAFENGFNRNRSGSIQVSVGQLDYNQIPIENLRLNADFVSGEIVVNEATGRVPGNGSFVSVGRVSSSVTGLQYQGLVEGSGQSLAEFIPMLGITKTQTLVKALPQYRARMNVTINPNETILSEVRILTGNEMRIAGGVSIKNDEQKNVKGNISIENLSVDPLSTSWLGGFSLLDDAVQSLLKPENPFAFNWLKDYSRNLEMEVMLKDFTFDEFAPNEASFRLFIAPQRLAVESLSMQLGDVAFSGDVSLNRDPLKPRPVIEGDLSISEIRLGNALREFIWVQEGEGRVITDNSVWSKETMNFNPLRYFDGKMKLDVGSILHEKFESRNAEITLAIEEHKLVVSDAQMQIWGGQFNLPFELDVSALPTFNARFTLKDGNLNQFLSSWVNFTNINGLFVLGGTMQASGVNFSNWINSMKGAVSFDARAMMVRHFNLSALMRSLQVLRTVAGLSNAVRTSFESGTTLFETVNGVVVFKDGQLSITNLDMRTNGAVGRMRGQFDLRQWQTDVDVDILMSLGDSAASPTLTMQFEGALEMPNRALNLKSIEAFLAKK